MDVHISSSQVAIDGECYLSTLVRGVFILTTSTQKQETITRVSYSQKPSKVASEKEE